MAYIYFVPTPIGNYRDMTLRGIEVLKNSDVIYCEDIKSSQELLSYYNIDKPLICYKDIEKEIIKDLNNYKIVAFIHNEGYSGLDRETTFIKNYAILNNIDIEVIPGANYLLTGLVSSGIPCDKFLYFGFLDSNNRINELKSIIDFDRTLVFYEIFNNINNTLNDMYTVLGARTAALSIDLTTDSERFIHFKLGDTIDIPGTSKTIVIVLEGAKTDSLTLQLNEMEICEHYDYYLKQGIDSKEAMKKVAKDRGVSKSDIYKVIKR